VYTLSTDKLYERIKRAIFGKYRHNLPKLLVLRHVVLYTGECLSTSEVLSDVSNAQFSTPDLDNDRWGIGNCAVLRAVAWWWAACGRVGLNGAYGARQGSKGCLWGEHTDLLNVHMNIKQIPA
jgi:hypothetical protein